MRSNDRSAFRIDRRVRPGRASRQVTAMRIVVPKVPEKSDSRIFDTKMLLAFGRGRPRISSARSTSRLIVFSASAMSVGCALTASSETNAMSPIVRGTPRRFTALSRPPAESAAPASVPRGEPAQPGRRKAPRGTRRESRRYLPHPRDSAHWQSLPPTRRGSPLARVRCSSPGSWRSRWPPVRESPPDEPRSRARPRSGYQAPSAAF